MTLRDALRAAGRLLWRLRSSPRGFLVLWLLIVVFLGRAALQTYQDHEAVSFTITAAPLAAAALLLLARSLLTPWKWHYILNSTGDHLPYARIGRIFYLAQLSSYIPGGVWQYLDMGYRATDDDRPLHAVAHSILYLHGTTVAASLWYAAVIGAWLLPAWRIPLILIATLLLLGVLGAPRILSRSKRWLARAGVDIEPYPCSARIMAGLFAIALLNWVVNGAFLYALVAGVTQTPLALLPHVSAIMAVAWAAGFLVLVVPGGLGVREGTMIVLLARLIPEPAAIAVSVLARILMLAAELAMAGLFTLYTNEGPSNA